MRRTSSMSGKAVATVMLCLLHSRYGSTQDPAVPAPAAADAAAPSDSDAPVKDALASQRAQLRVLDERLDTHRKERTELDLRTTASDAEAEAKSAELRRSDEALEDLERERNAVIVTIKVLSDERVSPADARSALAVQQQYLQQARDADNQAVVRVLETSTAALRLAAMAQEAETPGAADRGAAAAVVPPAQSTLEEIEFRRGDKLRYGPTISLLRFSVARDRAEPGRYRNYEPQLEFIPAEFGFAFVYQPHNRPWRINRKGNGTFQLISVGGMLLTSIDKNDVSRGSLSLAATLGFFQDIVGLGIGLDLYRGIETAGPGGAVGKDTAYTGLLAWSLSPRGEVTPENVFFVVTLGLLPLVNSITGELK